MYSQASGSASAHSEKPRPPGWSQPGCRLSEPAICQIEPFTVSISISRALVRRRGRGEHLVEDPPSLPVDAVPDRPPRLSLLGKQMPVGADPVNMSLAVRFSATLSLPARRCQTAQPRR